MPNITDTINQSMQQAGLTRYTRQAQPVINALVQREQEIAGRLLDEAQNMGANRADVVRLFEGVGMSLPVGQDAQGTGTEVADLRRQVDALTTFARRNGYTG